MGQLILLAVVCLGLYVWSSTAVIRSLTGRPERLPRAARWIVSPYPLSQSRSTRIVFVAVHAFFLAVVQWLMGSVLADAIAHGDVFAGLMTAGEWLGAAVWTGNFAYSYLGTPPIGSAH